jgi:hypothetical protein
MVSLYVFTKKAGAIDKWRQKPPLGAHWFREE